MEDNLTLIRKATEKYPEKINGKKIVITGGAGFLGSWLCDSLIAAGAEVVCIDNLSSGTFENIKHIKNNFTFVEQDVNDFAEVYDFSGTDFIFHLASLASPDYYQKHPIDTLNTNAIATRNLLDAARKCGAGFLFTSTSEVYGDAKIFPTPETYWGNTNPNGIRSCYDEGKRAGEAYCKAFERQYGFDVRIIRIFNTYGPRLRASEGSSYGRVVPRFIEQCLAGKPITIFGDGSQTRSFSYITDTIRGMILAAFDGKAKHEVFNIGNDREVTVLRLASLIKNITNSKSEIKFCPLPEDDPKRRQADAKKANLSLGWEPDVSIEEGLGKTINWVKSNL